MRTLTILVSLMCMALSVSAAKADRRVAFVVGNRSEERRVGKEC